MGDANKIRLSQLSELDATFTTTQNSHDIDIQTTGDTAPIDISTSGDTGNITVSTAGGAGVAKSQIKLDANGLEDTIVLEACGGIQQTTSEVAAEIYVRAGRGDVEIASGSSSGNYDTTIVASKAGGSGNLHLLSGKTAPDATTSSSDITIETKKTDGAIWIRSHDGARFATDQDNVPTDPLRLCSVTVPVCSIITLDGTILQECGVSPYNYDVVKIAAGAVGRILLRGIPWDATIVGVSFFGASDDAADATLAAYIYRHPVRTAALVEIAGTTGLAIPTAGVDVVAEYVPAPGSETNEFIIGATLGFPTDTKWLQQVGATDYVISRTSGVVPEKYNEALYSLTLAASVHGVHLSKLCIGYLLDASYP